METGAFCFKGRQVVHKRRLAKRQGSKQEQRAGMG